MPVHAYWNYNTEKWFDYDAIAFIRDAPEFRDIRAVVSAERSINGNSPTLSALEIVSLTNCVVTDANDSCEVKRAVNKTMIAGRMRRYPHYSFEWENKTRARLRLLLVQSKMDIKYVFAYRDSSDVHRALLDSSLDGPVPCVRTFPELNKGSFSYVALDNDTATLLLIAGVPLIEITDSLRKEIVEESGGKMVGYFFDDYISTKYNGCRP